VAKRLSIFLVAFLFILPLSAAEKHAPTIDELINLERPRTPRISPDGRFVAYSVRHANWTDNSYDFQIWLANTESGEVIQLTNSKRTNTSPAWSPDGRWLAFISDRDGRRQIYVISPAGGEARQVTRVETGVSQFRWSPDGARIALTMGDPETKEMKDRREKYSDFENYQHDYTMTHLWVVEVNSGETRRLTEGRQFTVGSFSWSPDGKQLAFDGQLYPGLSYSETNDIYIYNFDAHSVKKIVDQPGPNTNPEWSPDGKQIIFNTTKEGSNFAYADLNLAIVSAEGGPISYATKNFDEHATFAAWTAEGIYFTAAQKTASHLFRIDPKKLTIERVSPEENAAYSSFSFTSDFKSVAFVEADATHYPEVYVSGVRPFVSKKLTDFGGQIKDLKVATREVISWRSSDGKVIEGALMKPADFDPARKYPLLIVLHGGPNDVSQAIPGFDIAYYPKEMWAAKGALILEPNYRGSIGYGEKVRSLNVRNMGPGLYEDVISGVDYLISKGWVDKDRVGSMGWSFGGYITAYIATNSSRFRALSVGAGITDWTTYDVGTDMHWLARRYFESSPWDDPEVYRKGSPISSIKHAKTPTMIEQGEFDPRVPIANSYELYQGLRDQGVPVRFYIYKGFGHTIDRPRSSRAVMEHNLNWFNHYLWGEPDAEGSK
jgi:dipeptidyl aminopeptidase/acylaminoacyl peptidase